MCGRFTRDITWEQVHAFSQGLDLILPPEQPEPSWNVAPTQNSWVLVADPAGGAARQMRWGLLPSWAKDSTLGVSLINARLETVASKPAFRSAWKARRCLVPASGYYEWRLEDGIKQPYWIHDASSPVLMFAGLWENWKTPAADWLQSFSIITCAALDRMQELHDRTPLMLSPPVLRDWLHGSVEQATAIANQAPVPPLAWHAVSRAVGNPRSNGPRLVEPVPEPG
jgi:putative SOS response-associated peptidase YedK